MVVDDKLEPAGLKFQSVLTTPSLLEIHFSICKTFVVVRKYSELFFFHQVLILRLMEKELQLSSEGQLIFLFGVE